MVQQRDLANCKIWLEQQKEAMIGKKGFARASRLLDDNSFAKNKFKRSEDQSTCEIENR